MEVGGLVQVSLGIFFLLENHPKIALGVVGPIPSVVTLLKVVGYYDLSVLSMSLMGFQPKKVWIWGELYPSLFWIFGIFLTLQSPLLLCLLLSCCHKKSLVTRRYNNLFLSLVTDHETKIARQNSSIIRL